MRNIDSIWRGFRDALEQQLPELVTKSPDQERLPKCVERCPRMETPMFTVHFACDASENLDLGRVPITSLNVNLLTLAQKRGLRPR